MTSYTFYRRVSFKKALSVVEKQRADGCPCCIDRVFIYKEKKYSSLKLLEQLVRMKVSFGMVADVIMVDSGELENYLIGNLGTSITKWYLIRLHRALDYVETYDLELSSSKYRHRALEMAVRIIDDLDQDLYKLRCTEISG